MDLGQAWNRLLSLFRDPDLDELDDNLFEALETDGRLALRMSSAAEQVASHDARLDFSSSSLALIEEAGRNAGIDRKERWRLGCYFGEVIRRNAAGADWAWPSVRHQRKRLGPVVAIGRWRVDPFDIVERHPRAAQAHPEVTLSRSAEDLITYARNPTGKTARDLGWTNKRLDYWAVTRRQWRAWNRRRLGNKATG
jgi:hypothetical protein